MTWLVCSTGRRTPTSVSAAPRPGTTGMPRADRGASDARNGSRSRGIRIRKEACPILSRLGSKVPMQRIAACLIVCAIAGACSSAAKRLGVVPGPSPAARLAAADALVRAGCFDCLAAAYREYDALRSTPSVSDLATGGAIRSAALLAVRERELGTEDSGYLKKARDLAATTATATALLALLEIEDSLPTRGSRMVSDDVELVRMQAANRNRSAWTEVLRGHADEDPLAAYLWLSFNC